MKKSPKNDTKRYGKCTLCEVTTTTRNSIFTAIKKWNVHWTKQIFKHAYKYDKETY